MPHKIAAPSWVMAGSIYENCKFLEGKVDEVGLLFFEADSCLAYTQEDLPPQLADLALTYHVHMPLVLPWEKVDKVVELILQLMEKVRFLGVKRAVVHPPITEGLAGMRMHEALGAVRKLALAWQAAGYDCSDLLIENVDGVDLIDFLPVFREFGLGLCVDTGHMIAYGQDDLLAYPDIWEFLQMVHLNAPHDMTTSKGRSKHASLTMLDERGRRLVRNTLLRCKPTTVLMYELFKWEHVTSSIPVVNELLLTEADN